MKKEKILKPLLTLVGLLIFVGLLTKLTFGNSLTLSEYAASRGPGQSTASPSPTSAPQPESSPASVQPSVSSSSPLPTQSPDISCTLTGAGLNGSSVIDSRTEYAKGFYYEPLSDNLQAFIGESTVISFEELCYTHILHYDLDGNAVEGEFLCNRAIAKDLMEIFYELYQNEYRLGSMLLVEDFGTLTASLDANNSFCYYSASEDATGTLAAHSLGLAVDINPLYNPHITYAADGTAVCSPIAAADYADRTSAFPYKIDESDLCYKLFIKHGFIWGGNRNSDKAYQHFHKNIN